MGGQTCSQLVPNCCKAGVTEKEVDVYGIRPEHINLSSSKGKIKGTLRLLENLGADTLLYFDTEDYQKIVVRKEGIKSFEKGEVLFLDYDDTHLHMFKDGKRV